MPEIRADALDACVIALYRASREQPAETFQDYALDLVGELAPFDFAVWSRAALEDGTVRLYSAFELRMPPGATAAQLEMADRDVLGALAFANLGRTVNASHAASLTDDPVVIERLLKRFDLGHFLTTCLVDPFTALVSSITLMRREAAPAFTEQERATKERLTPHLVEAYTAARLLRLLQWRGGEAPYPNAVALCNAEGLLEFVSQQFAELIRREWPDWRGPRLPASLRLSSEEPVRRQLSAIALRAEPVAGAIAVRVRPRLPVDDLSAREAEIARLSALGRSNKEIGQDLALSPFTVRNHLDSVYRKLGVSKRSELGAILPELEDLAESRAG
ncbi:helix-turn-helix transcriptional regulator [Phenylobacterium sp.]|uniref:helix-turn-helix transcriptional regulator n=1 Tax=Phenylobacterium sp. TaxID=1871053 RepID=UPI002F401021